MEKADCFYNNRINCVEVLPQFLRQGIEMAKNYCCGVQITADFWGMFEEADTVNEEVILDFSSLAGYPELPELIIEDNFKVGRTVGLEILYSLEQLAVLSVKTGRKNRQNFQIDVGKIPNLLDLRFDFSKKITNVANAKKLTRLYIRSYKSQEKNLTEFQELVYLRDFLLVSPNIENLSGIENMTGLEKFEIAYAGNLNDISALCLLEGKHKIQQLVLPVKFKEYLEKRKNG